MRLYSHFWDLAEKNPGSMYNHTQAYPWFKKIQEQLYKESALKVSTPRIQILREMLDPYPVWFTDKNDKIGFGSRYYIEIPDEEVTMFLLRWVR